VDKISGYSEIEDAGSYPARLRNENGCKPEESTQKRCSRSVNFSTLSPLRKLMGHLISAASQATSKLGLRADPVSCAMTPSAGGAAAAQVRGWQSTPHGSGGGGRSRLRQWRGKRVFLSRSLERGQGRHQRSAEYRPRAPW
jgi:hypothetical protein